MRKQVKKGFIIFFNKGLLELMYLSIRFLSERSPYPFFRFFRKSSPELYYNLSRKIYLRKNEFDVDDYNSPLDPYKVLWVSPDRIKKTTGASVKIDYYDRISRFGQVLEGDWDLTDRINVDFGGTKTEDAEWFVEIINSNNFEDSIFFKSVEAHFKRGLKWENTEFYSKTIEGLEEGKPPFYPYGSDKKEFIDVLENIDSLYTSIDSKGFLKPERISFEPFFDVLNESILVDIGRDGELLFVEGRRRLTVAKILGVNEIPVRVLVRHKKWMEYRDKVYNKGLDVSHPDFKEFKE